MASRTSGHQGLTSLLNDCTIRVSFGGNPIPSGNFGTGFFIAPKLILTCAHVVAPAHTSEANLTVQWRDQEYPASINSIVPEPPVDDSNLAAAYPYPDLALINAEVADHPCIYFDLQGSEPTLTDKLYSYGYTTIRPTGEPAYFDFEGISEGAEPLIKLSRSQAAAGMSGAPLLNSRTGAVCGIIKASRDVGFDLGGRAVPSSTILSQFEWLVRRQRTFHDRERSWIQNLAVRQRLETGWREPIDEVELAVTVRLKRIDEDYLAIAMEKLGKNVTGNALPSALARELIACGRSDLEVVVDIINKEPTAGNVPREVYEAVAPLTWIEAAAISHLYYLTHTSPPCSAVAINSSRPMTAKLYMQCASRTYPPPLKWKIVEASTPQGEVTPAEFIISVQEAITRALKWDPTDLSGLQRFLATENYFIVVIIPPPTPDIDLARVLLESFPAVLFFFLTGEEGGKDQLLKSVPKAQFLLPELDTDLETVELDAYYAMWNSLQELRS